VSAQLRGVAVLVADDDPDNLEILAYIMSDEGANVRTARNAREALNLLPAWTPDVVLLDIEMPVVNGYDLLSAIRRHAGLHDVPAVAVTGLGYPSDKDRSFAAGFEAHVTKPFDGRALIDLVEWLASRDPRPAGSSRANRSRPVPASR
jgi:CheY-like chemotaxis protein